jgi:hypothetical protein
MLYTQRLGRSYCSVIKDRSDPQCEKHRTIALKPERSSLVAASAILKIADTKCPLAIVTAAAARSPGRRKVHRKHGFRHLPAACLPGSHRVASRACHALACVFGVAEVHRIGSRLIRVPDRSRRNVASPARTDVSPPDLSLRPVAAETCRVCAHSRWNGQPYSATVWRVTC